MAKTLRSVTIIPKELYVSRAADRQTDDIVEGMGRPGYVLVARQMGKTNLLINLKRNREAKGDIVLYLDLSNRVESSRGFFRNVIDIALESASLLSNPVSAIISKQRINMLEPNVEFDRHLREIMRAIGNRRMVVILDEIDSLASVAYSDVIFAQIRSMYFSRTNYPEYDRLTYVLSGVAETNRG